MVWDEGLGACVGRDPIAEHWWGSSWLSSSTQAVVAARASSKLSNSLGQTRSSL
jgi:hypothetical protein